MKSCRQTYTAQFLASPPARGAWIEIFAVFLIPAKLLSPPARGAWIEMPEVMQMT